MSAKMLLPNQCSLLHFFYGHDDCCLCKANQRIAELEQQLAVARLEKEIAELKDMGFVGGSAAVTNICPEDSEWLRAP